MHTYADCRGGSYCTTQSILGMSTPRAITSVANMTVCACGSIGAFGRFCLPVVGFFKSMTSVPPCLATPAERNLSNKAGRCFYTAADT
jgi:hypothetical protein